MAAINTRRVILGGVVGGVIWTIWSTAVNLGILMSHFTAEGAAGHILKQPRYSLFVPYWFVTLFALSFILAWLYASVRATLGAGPKTALTLGVLLGFALAFPENLVQAAWSPLPRIIPFWWMLDLWVGAILSTFVAAWLYKD